MKKSLDRKAYARLITNVEGTSLSQEDRDFLTRRELAGVILFTRNYENRRQLERLVESIRAVDSSLLICVDQEGGRVQRLKTGFTEIPEMAKLGEAYQLNAETALKTARRVGWLLAAELLAAQIDFSFTPVVDIDFDTSSIIGNRALSNDAQVVSQLAAALVQGMQSAGMKSCAKHFPGHGGIGEDSHLAAASDSRSWQQLCEKDLIPYHAVTNAYDSVMTAHIQYPEVDEPIATYSKRWINKILRGEMMFQGCVFSDDLTMKGAAVDEEEMQKPNYKKRTELALKAGCDAIIVCNDRSAAQSACDSIADFVERQGPTKRSICVKTALRAKRYHDLAQLVASPVYKAAKQSVGALAG